VDEARPLEFLFVIDLLEALVLETETSLLLMEEGAARGHRNSIAYLPDLYLADREPRVRARGIEVDESTRPFYRLGEVEDRPIASFDLVLMRKDPPIDIAYLTGLSILEPARENVPVVNDPVGLRRSVEKLLPLEIPGAPPPSVVTADPAVASAFVREHGDVVIKPLYEFSGRGIERLSAEAARLDAEAIGALAVHGGGHVLIQRFLPEVERGDKRILVLEGEVLGCVNRVPRPGSFRANIHQGASVAPADPNERERSVIETARPLLEARGLAFAGFDFIGPWLTEINVTSPSAMRQIDEVTGCRLERRVVDWMEARAREGVRHPLST